MDLTWRIQSVQFPSLYCGILGIIGALNLKSCNGIEIVLKQQGGNLWLDLRLVAFGMR